jgi:hypothetical protein
MLKEMNKEVQIVNRHITKPECLSLIIWCRTSMAFARFLMKIKVKFLFSMYSSLIRAYSCEKSCVSYTLHIVFHIIFPQNAGNFRECLFPNFPMGA